MQHFYLICVQVPAQNVPALLLVCRVSSSNGFTVQNFLYFSQTNSREWEKYLQNMVSRDHKYVLLTKVQLVGVMLYVFIRPHLAPVIR